MICGREHMHDEQVYNVQVVKKHKIDMKCETSYCNVGLKKEIINIDEKLTRIVPQY